MKLYNLKDHNEQVSFAQAVTQGLGKHQGLFFPHDLPEFSLTEIDDMLAQDFVTRSAKILSAFIGDEIPQDVLQQRVRAAFAFPAPVSKVQEDVGCLELFHGPTLAFKDFGGRFMAQMLTHIAGDKPVTILTATSGDTGAAVAHAFYGLPNVKVVILYPRGKISPLQEKLFCTLGGNIETVAIDGDFDACQALVKQAFDDEELKATDRRSAGQVAGAADQALYRRHQRQRHRSALSAGRRVGAKSHPGDAVQRHGRQPAEQLAAR